MYHHLPMFPFVQSPAPAVNTSHGPVLAVLCQLVSRDLRDHLPAVDVEIGMA